MEEAVHSHTFGHLGKTIHDCYGRIYLQHSCWAPICYACDRHPARVQKSSESDESNNLLEPASGHCGSEDWSLKTEIAIFAS
ncbi:DNA-directed RNA polymerases I and III subunit [Trichinella spiralis]|uniref:DNA-directed RNA polymerases I and III subunit n=1 Tax=Trichinella spiralis TaxID=6334 RepID=A0ABR3KB70_TRISP